MPIALPTLLLGNFLLMAALPALFFRPGNRLQVMWWLTAAPFIASGRLVALARRGAITPWFAYSASVAAIVDAVAVVCSVASLVLIVAAWHAHPQPPALWHQDDDQPTQLITTGVYARIRHPLYAAYLLALSGAALAIPHPVTLVAWASGWWLLDHTARREERRLCVSAFGAAYAVYMRRSGRFRPRWRDGN